jgi:hypothetical protein
VDDVTVPLELRHMRYISWEGDKPRHGFEVIRALWPSDSEDWHRCRKFIFKELVTNLRRFVTYRDEYKWFLEADLRRALITESMKCLEKTTT